MARSPRGRAPNGGVFEAATIEIEGGQGVLAPPALGQRAMGGVHDPPYDHDGEHQGPVQLQRRGRALGSGACGQCVVEEHDLGSTHRPTELEAVVRGPGVAKAGGAGDEGLPVAGGQPGIGPDGPGQGVPARSPRARWHGGEQVEAAHTVGDTRLVAPEEPGHELSDRVEVAPSLTAILVTPERAVELPRDGVEADRYDSPAGVAHLGENGGAAPARGVPSVGAAVADGADTLAAGGHRAAQRRQ